VRQELVSPNGRYRAVTEYIHAHGDFPGISSDGGWYRIPSVALRIIPNDRPLAWTAQRCPSGIKYRLESDEALLSWNGSVPVMTWLSGDDLVVQCDTCSVNDLQIAHLDLFPHKITALDKDYKRIEPQVVYPDFECQE
jgi:hypothetical protein